MRSLVRSLSLALPVVLAASAAGAQTTTQSADEPRRHLTLQAGGFTFDYGGDQTAPLAALRVDWAHNRIVRTEIGVMGARPKVTLVPDPSIPGGTIRETRANFVGLDVSAQAQLPTPFVQPYVGIGTGIFGYFEPEGGDRYFAPTTSALAGIRTSSYRGLGLRGEVRFRFDHMQGGGVGRDAEATLGLTWAW